LEMRWTTGE